MVKCMLLKTPGVRVLRTESTAADLRSHQSLKSHSALKFPLAAGTRPHKSYKKHTLQK